VTPFEGGTLVVCFLLSIVFSASEAALLSMTTERYDEALSQYRRRAAILDELLLRPRNLMVVILVANMAVNALFVAMAASVVVAHVGVFRGMVLSVLLLTAVVALFAEILPKVVATKFPLQVALWTAYPVYVASWVTAPVIAVTDGLVALLVRPAPESQDAERSMTEEELRTYLELSRNEGVLAAGESEMIDSVFDFTDTVVREVMTPRTDVDALPENASFDEVITFLDATPRSRIPVYREHLDDIIGIVYAKELLPFVMDDGRRGQFRLTDLLRDPFFVPEVMKCDDLLRELRQRRMALAVVVDEYGGTAGVVSIEDLLEEIFGDIQDETDDDDEYKVVPRPEGGWLVDARLHIEEVNAELPLRIPEGEFDTIGGFVFDQIGHLPVVGDQVTLGDHVLNVHEMDGHRLSIIAVVPGTSAAASTAGVAGAAGAASSVGAASSAGGASSTAAAPPKGGRA